MFNHHIGLDQPADYLIKIQGRLNDLPADWFLGPLSCEFETGEQGEVVTVLRGQIADQPALHGLLRYIRDLGLVLLYVDCLSARADDSAPADFNSSDQAVN